MNFIFDIGSVLIRFQPLEFLETHFDENLARRLYRLIFCGAEWIALDRGTLTIQQATDRFCAAAPDLQPEILQTMQTYCNMMDTVPGMEILLRQLHEQGNALYYLSNMPEHSAEYLLQEFSFFSLFRGGVFSYAMKALKPEPEIYSAFLMKFGLEARACVFIDDLPVNVEAARQIGMRGIVFTSSEKLEQDLRQFIDE